MTYEAQIVLRRENLDELTNDVRAVSEFLEERNRIGSVSVRNGFPDRHLRAVPSRELQVAH